MQRQKTNRVRITVLVVSCVCIFAVSAFVLNKFRSPDAGPVTTASVTRNDPNTGIVLVPDGNGNCNKYSYGNDSGKATYEGTAPCDNSRPNDPRGNLPPALRGMQNSLRN